MRAAISGYHQFAGRIENNILIFRVAGRVAQIRTIEMRVPQVSPLRPGFPQRHISSRHRTPSPLFRRVQLLFNSKHPPLPFAQTKHTKDPALIQDTNLNVRPVVKPCPFIERLAFHK